MSKTCYYELMGLNYGDRTSVDGDVIKKAYRKVAMKMHPDKAHINNLSVEEATTRFQEIQEAYETLSDPQERAWYDQHRERILSGQDLGEGGDSFADNLDICQYFKSYPFDDSPRGFFTVFRDLFERVDAEEMQWQEVPKQAPVFGSSSSPWSVTGAFYSNWLNFCTRRPCGHADKWRAQDGQNRNMRRAMEVENKQARNAAKKEYNADIRALVRRLHRRDPRVQAKKEEDEAKKVAKKAQEDAQRQEEKQQQKLHREEARRLEQDRWAQVDAERQAKGEALTESDDEEEVVYFCEACSKSFKSDKAFHSHTQSKKHKKLWEELLTRKLAEEEALGVGVEEEEESCDTDLSQSCDKSPVSHAKSVTSMPHTKEHKSVSSTSRKESHRLDDGATPSSSSSAASFGAFGRGKKIESSECVDINKRDSGLSQPISAGHTDGVSDNAEGQSRAGEEEAKAVSVVEDKDTAEGEDKERKKKRRRNKDKGKGIGAKNGVVEPLDAEELQLRCGKCGDAFDTRNALFAHLKRFPAHALLKDVPVDKKSKRKGKR